MTISKIIKNTSIINIDDIDMLILSYLIDEIQNIKNVSKDILKLIKSKQFTKLIDTNRTKFYIYYELYDFNTIINYFICKYKHDLLINTITMNDILFLNKLFTKNRNINTEKKIYDILHILPIISLLIIFFDNNNASKYSNILKQNISYNLVKSLHINYNYNDYVKSIFYMLKFYSIDMLTRFILYPNNNIHILDDEIIDINEYSTYEIHRINTNRGIFKYKLESLMIDNVLNGLFSYLNFIVSKFIKLKKLN